MPESLSFRNLQLLIAEGGLEGLLGTADTQQAQTFEQGTISLDASQVNWQIFHTNQTDGSATDTEGAPVYQGTGTEVDAAVLSALEPGIYQLVFSFPHGENEADEQANAKRTFSIL